MKYILAYLMMALFDQKRLLEISQSTSDKHERDHAILHAAGFGG